MGVPSLFKYLCRLVPNFTRRARWNDDFDFSQPNPNGREYDNLYIDLNGLIHGSLDYTTIEQTIESLNQKILELVSIVRPRSLLFISIDGVCPVAKMVQQRKRRFTPDNEDGNKITPGTDFMEKISTGVESFILSQMNNVGLDYFRRIKTIVSGVHSPGEGEHKIIEFIRSQKRVTESHVICGEDADLLLLSLTLHTDNIFILRKFTPPTKQYSRPKKNGHGHAKVAKDKSAKSEKPQKSDVQLFDFVNITLLSNKLVSMSAEMGKEINRTQLENDFVFLMSLAGNDFVPNVPGVDVYSGSFKMALTCYFKLSSGGVFLTKNDDINFPAFKEFLEKLRENEEMMVKTMVRTRTTTCPGVTGYVTKDTNKLVRIGEANWRSRYEKVLFQSNEEYMKRGVKEYIKGIVWVYLYYTGHPISWEFGYRPFYAPTLTMLNTYFEVDIKEVITPTPPLSPLVQLVLVLPPKSSRFLPLPLQTIFEEDWFSEISPKKPTIDLNGECVGYKGIPLVNFPSIERAKEYVNARISSLTPLEKARDRVLDDILFVFNGIPNFGNVLEKKEIDFTHHGVSGQLMSTRYGFDAFYFNVQNSVMKELQNKLVFGYFFKCSNSL
ncbi:5'-_3' exoribonuclease, putative [Entamoeba invadens IP1]|uniref:5'->3' exoribonuclease, putative n=1 Tax=Entamoeba invadens IP1 TaxID=370355 RepID=A0A0A1U836_ENTIV|nr:5'->3' exoribonuclease, putative [Entamoeba invadens IP1]ELP91094.1 5'->3' exoribonuclease, putative [Entamoeba invadens IP1]|eukprot:XP_004257865.1 5'-_3' exoribonuclease, putative [Entamoeba invadens IP1]